MAIPEYLRESLARAPLIAEGDVDEDELAEVLQRSAEIDAGTAQMVEHAEVQQTIAQMRKLAG
jgi:hypothetical protein